MRILAIETSCDETAISIVEAQGSLHDATFRVLGNALATQVEIHAKYGGVFPALAKREHAKNLIPLLEATLEEAELLHEDTQALPQALHDRIAKLLEREPGLDEAFLEFVSETEPPDIDAIAVTNGPGLEPALWVGVNFAKALALVWNKPLIGVNHLEGHILSSVATGDETNLVIKEPLLPLVALGIAGGHTDLILMKKWLRYEILGGTLDDSVGEAFDKVARMLGLPYPGGPQVSRLAEIARLEQKQNMDFVSPYILPRPMLKSGTYAFSFSGLKTAVLYMVKDKDFTDAQKQHMAREFEDAVADVLWTKTKMALTETGAKTLVVSGGVSANTHIRRVFEERVATDYPGVTLRLSPKGLSTDNAIMIALAGYFRALRQDFADPDTLKADGNLSLANTP